MLQKRTLRVLALVAVSLTTHAAAQPADPSPVFTRAKVASFLDTPEGKHYVRLQLLPRAKLPFTTQTFRVADRTLLAGIREGAWVKFAARPIDGAITVTAIHAVPECRRFEKCD